LRLAFVENLKVLFMKIPDGVPLGVPNHGAHDHQLNVHLECRGFVVRSELYRVLLACRLGGSARSGNRMRITLRECRGWAGEKPYHA